MKNTNSICWRHKNCHQFLVSGGRNSFYFFDCLLDGKQFISFGLIFFAFTTILGWNYYGERCILYLTGTTKSIKPFKIIYILAIAIAPFMTLDPIWMLADITNALMGIPNLIALLGLRKVVISETKKYFQAKETVVAAEGIQELS